MKFLHVMSFLILPNFAHAISCNEAILSVITTPAYKIEKTTITKIGNENLVEVSSLVLGWYPKSDARSEYYYLVTATCQLKEGSKSTHISNLELYNDMPGEGGVYKKVLTKARQ